MLAADRLAATVTERDKINNAPTLPHPFGKPKGGEVRKATRIHVQSDVRHVAEVGLNAPLVGKRPGSVLPPALAKGLHPFHEHGQLLLSRGLKDTFGRDVGLEILAILNSNALKHAHRDQVSFLHRLFLNHPVEAYEEALIKVGYAVERFAVDVDEALFGRICRLRERIDPQLFDQCQRSFDIDFGRAGRNRPQQPIAVVGRKSRWDKSGRYVPFEIWRQQQVFRGLALVLILRADAHCGDIPRVDNGSKQSRAHRSRNLKHHRPVFKIKVGVNVVRRCVRRGHLESPLRRLREVADIIVLRADIAEIRLPHCVGVDQRHAPDDRLNRAALNRALGQFGRAERRRRFCFGLFLLGQCRGREHQCDYGDAERGDRVFDFHLCSFSLGRITVTPR